MGLSSNILWQQTDRKGLTGILKTKMLKYGYSRERVFEDQKKQQFAIPMVSMCDIPFSELNPYLGKYGNYSIGLTREWGYKNHFNSVWYYRRNSSVYKMLSKALKDAQANDNREVIKTVFGLLCYMKFEEASLIQKNYNKYRFMDEREFRLCPSFEELQEAGASMMLDEEGYSKYKSENNGSSILQIGIPFDWSDVKYIIIKSGTSPATFKKLLKEEGCNNDQICIFTENQVKEDFIGVDHDVKVEESAYDPIMDLVTGRKSILDFMMEDIKAKK